MIDVASSLPGVCLDEATMNSQSVNGQESCMRVEGVCVCTDLFHRAKNSRRQVNETEGKIPSKQTNGGKQIASNANNDAACPHCHSQENRKHDRSNVNSPAAVTDFMTRQCPLNSDDSSKSHFHVAYENVFAQIANLNHE